ncbi:MAG: hypothetical protein E7352_06585 [Clostridiales bacterium]|nr:hypothetical protein [Clostridiales bacterium]
MYCRNCGKWIDDDAELCVDCKETNDFFSEEPSEEPSSVARGTSVGHAVEGSRKTGLGKALTATILSAISYFLIMFAAGLILGALEECEEYGYYYEFSSMIEFLEYIEMYEITLFFLLAPIGMSIPALIMGILSIVCFKREKNAGRVKPIPTLILGIVGLVLAALVLFLGLILLMCLAL